MLKIDKNKKIKIGFLILGLIISIPLLFSDKKIIEPKKVIYVEDNPPKEINFPIPAPTPSKYDSVSTADPSDNQWKIYENKTLGFKIKIPSIWEITEEVEYSYIFFYDPSYKNKVSIFPKGKETHARSSPTTESNIITTIPVLKKIDYLTSKGDRYATDIFLIIPKNTGWNQYSLIEAEVDTSGLEQGCVNKITREESPDCDLWQGDQIVYVGKINPEEREIIEKIIESFEFTDPI